MARKIQPTRYPDGRITIGEGMSYSPRVDIVNPSDRDWRDNRFLLSFGAMGSTHLLVWAGHLEDAIETAAEYLAKHAPGHIMEEWGGEHKELVREVCEERGVTFPEGFDALEDEVKWDICEAAESDLMRTESGFITSYEWAVSLENPTRAELAAFIGAV